MLKVHFQAEMAAFDDPVKDEQKPPCALELLHCAVSGLVTGVNLSPTFYSDARRGKMRLMTVLDRTQWAKRDTHGILYTTRHAQTQTLRYAYI